MESTLKDSKVKILSVFLSVIFIIGMFAGCGNNQNSQAANSSQVVDTANQSTNSSQSLDTASQSSSVQTTETKTTQYPLSLKDAAGTSVTITSKPAKIVSLPLGTCEMLLSLVDKSSIAAMTNYVDDANVSNVADVAKGIGQRLDSNAEKIIALQPDLVFVDSWAPQDFVKQLRDAKLTVFVLNVPANIDQEKEILKLLGNITDQTIKAEETVNWMDGKLKGISDRLAKLKEEQKLTILDYSEMNSTSGKGTNFDDVVTRAGLINPVAKDGIDGWPDLSKEMVIKYNPDIISLPSWYYDSKISFNSLSESIKSDKSLAGVNAVKNDKLISVPYNHLSTTSQYSVLGIEDMAKAAYPDLFK
ncbi:MAG: ABC transporter substrate-binding protein [Ruminiclostridium sp.]